MTRALMNKRDDLEQRRSQFFHADFIKVICFANTIYDELYARNEEGWVT